MCICSELGKCRQTKVNGDFIPDYSKSKWEKEEKEKDENEDNDEEVDNGDNDTCN